MINHLNQKFCLLASIQNPTLLQISSKGRVQVKRILFLTYEDKSNNRINQGARQRGNPFFVCLGVR